jgi:hypothetical protein
MADAAACEAQQRRCMQRRWKRARAPKTIFFVHMGILNFDIYDCLDL